MGDLGLAYIALGIMCFAIGIVGLGEGIAVAKGFEGVGRNPACAGTMRTSMIVGVALIETCGIYSFVIALIFLFTVIMPQAGATLDAMTSTSETVKTLVQSIM